MDSNLALSVKAAVREAHELSYPLLITPDESCEIHDLVARLTEAGQSLRAEQINEKALAPRLQGYLNEFRKSLPAHIQSALDRGIQLDSGMLTGLSIAQCAALTYTLSHSAQPPVMLFPTETILRSLAERVDPAPDGIRLPLSTERLETYLNQMKVSLAACPPELVRAVDELNMLCARLSIGHSPESMWVRPLTALNLGQPREEHPSVLDSHKADLPVDSNAPMTLPHSEILQSLGAHITGWREEPFTRALLKAALVVPRFIPPPTDERLYPLVACALLCHKLGIKKFELGPSAALDSRIVISEIKLHGDGGVRKIPPARLLGGLKPDERLALAYLVGELPLSDMNSARTAARLLRFFETIGERPFSFGDLFSAALLAGASKAALSKASPQMSLDPPAVDFQFFRHASLFQASYVNAKDLRQLGTPPDHIETILMKAWQAQLLGLVRTREGALAHSALLLRGLGGKPADHTGLCSRTGAVLKNFVHVVTLGQKKTDNYIITRCHSLSRQQFSPRDADAAVERELIASHNYPQIARHLGAKTFTLSALLEALRSGKIRNLVELEYFCASVAELKKLHPHMKADIADVLMSGLSTGAYAKVQRLRDIELSRIAVCIGYQGKNHVGMGLRHVIEQRCKDGSLAAFQKKHGGTGDPMATFIDEAVLQVAATGLAKVPSSQYPGTHLLLSGAVEAAKNHFLTLVLADTGKQLNHYRGSVQVITALYHTSPSALRTYLYKELNGWIQNNRITDRAKVESLLLGVNGVLLRAGEGEIRPRDLGFEEEEERELELGAVLKASAGEGEFLDASLEEIESDRDMLASIDTFEEEEELRATVSLPPVPRPEPVERGLVYRASVGRGEPAVPTRDEYDLANEGFVFNPALAQVLL